VGVVRLQPDLVVPSDVPPQAVLPASYVGLLLDAAGKPAALVSSRRHGVELSVKLLQPLALPAGSEAVLWALAKDMPPLRLGVLRSDAKQTLSMSATSETLLSKVTELAVSVAAGRRGTAGCADGRRAASCCAATASSCGDPVAPAATTVTSVTQPAQSDRRPAVSDECPGPVDAG
jgi:hypothetical protein